MRQEWSDDRIERELHALRSEMSLRFERVDVRLDEIDVKLEKVDARFEKLDDRLDARFETIHLRLDGMQRTLVQFCTAMLALFAVMLAAFTGIALS